jgi:hypothetical protein
MRMALAILIALQITFLANVGLAQNANTLTGSGVVISGHGDILTNSHVIEDCKNVTVQILSERKQPAVLIASDQENDLAILRMKASTAAVCRISRERATTRWRLDCCVGLPPFRNSRDQCEPLRWNCKRTRRTW